MNNIPSLKKINRDAAIKSLVIGLGLSLIIIFAIPPLLINPILNGLKNSALKEIKTGNVTSGDVSYSFFFNEAEIKNITYEGSARGYDSVNARAVSIKIQNINWLKYFLGMGISAGEVSVNDPDVQIGGGGKMRDRPENKGFSSLPAMMFQESGNDSSSGMKDIYIREVNINSGRYVSFNEGRKDSVGEFYIIANDVKIKEGAYPDLSRLNFLIRNACKTFDKGYKLTIDYAQFIGRENLLEAENVKYFSDMTNERYFALLTSREDKLAFKIDSLTVKVGTLKIGEKPSLLVEMIKMKNPTVDITTPKYIPLPENAPKLEMPNEALLSLPFGIKIDSVYSEGGSIILNELYQPQGRYAVLRFEKMILNARNITGRYFNNTNPAKIKIKAYLQGKGEMDLDLTMPMQQREFSYQASGSLKQMDLRELNGYLEYAEYIQITSGTAEKVNYEIKAFSGYAETVVTPVYNDIAIKSLDEETGKESGLDEKISSFLANKFVLRKSNPDPKEGLITSRVAKTFGPDETFFERLWLPLKRGLGDVVGFAE